jgi:hypothetical protein
LLTVVDQAAVGDLNDQGNVLGFGASTRVVADLASDDRSVRFRLADLVRESDRLARPHVPARRKQAIEFGAAQVIGRGVRVVLDHLGHEYAIDQMDFVARSKDSRVNHSLLLVER